MQRDHRFGWLIILIFLALPRLPLADPAAIIVDAPYVRAAPPRQLNAAFMTLANPNSHEHILIGASSPRSNALAHIRHALFSLA